MTRTIVQSSERRLILLAIACTLATQLGGCVTRRQGVSVNAFLTTIADQIGVEGSAAGAPRIEQQSPAPPRRVLLARISGHSKQSIDSREHKPYDPVRANEMRLGNRTSTFGRQLSELPAAWLVDEGINRAQRELSASRVVRTETILASSLLQVPTRTYAKELVRLAQDSGADWLCIFSPQTSYSDLWSDGWALMQVVTLGFAPSIAEADAQIESTIVDVRNGVIVDRWSHQEKGWQPAIGNTREAASRQTADRAESRALRAVLDRIDEQIMRVSSSP